MYASLLFTAVLVVVLWRSSMQRTSVTLGVLAVALLVVGGHWFVARTSAGLPRRMAEQPGLNDEIVVRMVAATNQWALFAKPDFGLVRVSLPDGAILGQYDFGEERVGFVESVAIGDDSVALTYVSMTDNPDGSYRQAWAVLGADGWRVRPGSRPESAWAATWEPATRTFLLTSEGHLEDSTPGEDHVTTFSNTRIDARGTVVDRSVHRLRNAVQVTWVCYVGDQAYGAGRIGGSPCRVTDASQCEPLALPTIQPGDAASDAHRARGFSCPEMRIETSINSGLITPAGLRYFRFPPGAPGSQMANSHVQRAPDGSVSPRFEWITPDRRSALEVGDDYLFAEYLDDSAAARLGHVVGETQLILVDATGRERGRSYLSDSAGAALYALVSGEEIVLLTAALDRRARFDRATLARLDAPDTLTAVRNRLSRWGGRSAMFEIAWAASLGSPALLLPLGLVVWWRRQTRFGRGLTAQRVGLFYLAFAVPTLVAALVRLFYL